MSDPADKSGDQESALPGAAVVLRKKRKKKKKKAEAKDGKRKRPLALVGRRPVRVPTQPRLGKSDVYEAVTSGDTGVIEDTAKGEEAGRETSIGGWSARDAMNSEAELFAVVPDDILMPGQVISGRYEIIDVLGEGGFGVVYQARHNDLGTDVAIKTLRRGIVDYDEAVQRFRREAKLARKLSHPNTIRLFDFGQTESGTLYIVMELLEGMTLEDHVFDLRPLTLTEAHSVGIQIASSLSEAHQQEVVHRDMKPSNVFLSEIGGEKNVVKVLDFGIAKVTTPDGDSKLTRTGTAFGSPAYMSPEQVHGVGISYASDVYSFSLIMLEAITGIQVVDGTSPFDVALQQASDEPIPIPTWVLESPLGHILQKAAAKEIEDRYPTAAELLEALEAVAPESITEYRRSLGEDVSVEELMAREPVVAPRPKRTEVEAENARSRVRLFGALAAIAVTIAAIAIGVLLTREEPKTPPAETKAPTPTTPVVDPVTQRDHFDRLADVLSRSIRGTVAGGVTNQILPRRPLGVSAERLPIPLFSRSTPLTPIIVLANAYRAVETVPVVETTTESAIIAVDHPVALAMTRSLLVSSFAGGKALQKVVLKFTSSPRGAVVFRRGARKALGKTPLEVPVVQSPASTNYRLEAHGYETVDVAVSHEENVTTAVQMRKSGKRITVDD